MGQSNCLIVFAFFGLLSGCSQSPQREVRNDVTLQQSAALWDKNDQLQAFFLDWQGTPYRFGGESKLGIDCSAFVQKAFIYAFNHALPRTTLAQVEHSVAVDWQQKQRGDLLFFKTAPSQYHVGIYLSGKQFMHASTSKGVIVSRLDNPYWASRFWQVRRVTM